MFKRWCTIVFIVYYFASLIYTSPVQKIRYISTEHPQVLYVNQKYFAYANLTSKRYGRATPFYFVDLHLKTVVTFANNVTVHFYFFEYLSNVYKRSFVEMHLKWCDLIHKDKFFGAPMKQGKLGKPCPHPPDEYHVYNASINVDVIPPEFPFTKGRIYANVTATDDITELMGYGYIDMEVKEVSLKQLNAQKNKRRRTVHSITTLKKITAWSSVNGVHLA